MASDEAIRVNLYFNESECRFSGKQFSGPCTVTQELKFAMRPNDTDLADISTRHLVTITWENGSRCDYLYGQVLQFPKEEDRKTDLEFTIQLIEDSLPELLGHFNDHPRIKRLGIKQDSLVLSQANRDRIERLVNNANGISAIKFPDQEN